MSKKITIVHLYPKEMNIYGDTGNRLILQKRLEWRGYKPEIHLIGIGDPMPKDVDIILGGGGQDSGQSLVQADLKKRSSNLEQLADDGVVMLVICGLYQLFGHYFKTSDGTLLEGVSLLDIFTEGSSQRIIGNTTVNSQWGDLVGYENHSGLTTLADGQNPLAQAKRGTGNNGTDDTEGAHSLNIFGSYLHGPILSKNPVFADELLTRALSRRHGIALIEPLDDSLSELARTVAKKRPR